MKIKVYIVDFGSLNDLLDSPLTWESTEIPLVGDNLYLNEPLDFEGEVAKRIFTVGTDEVTLDIEIDNETYDKLSDYLEEFRTNKRAKNE